MIFGLRIDVILYAVVIVLGLYFFPKITLCVVAILFVIRYVVNKLLDRDMERDRLRMEKEFSAFLSNIENERPPQDPEKETVDPHQTG